VVFRDNDQVDERSSVPVQAFSRYLLRRTFYNLLICSA
jgi:hypothetical protein